MKYQRHKDIVSIVKACKEWENCKATWNEIGDKYKIPVTTLKHHFYIKKTHLEKRNIKSNDYHIISEAKRGRPKSESVTERIYVDKPSGGSRQSSKSYSQIGALPIEPQRAGSVGSNSCSRAGSKDNVDNIWNQRSGSIGSKSLPVIDIDKDLEYITRNIF